MVMMITTLPKYSQKKSYPVKSTMKTTYKKFFNHFISHLINIFSTISLHLYVLAISRSAKIGSSSVVLKPIPECCTAVGNPARVRYFISAI